jgi:nitroreductase
MTAIPLVAVQAPYELTQSLYGRRTAPSRSGSPPSTAQVIALLEAAAAVPDHGYVRPWRFVVVSEPARERLADALAADAIAATGDPAAGERARQKAFAAPCLIVLVASPKMGSPVPAWEQLASAACTGYAIVLAAHGLGLGAIWKSTTFRDGPELRSFCHCSEHEQLLGWVLVGSRDETSRPKRTERPSFDAASLVTIVE